MPLWLPGERSRQGALADAESKALDSRVTAAQLRTAAAVRDAWWNWQRARGEQSLARERLVSAQKLAEDVRRRVKAGDLARSDQHQADGVAASAEVTLAESASLLAAATQQLRALIGKLPEEEQPTARKPRRRCLPTSPPWIDPPSGRRTVRPGRSRSP